MMVERFTMDHRNYAVPQRNAAAMNAEGRSSICGPLYLDMCYFSALQLDQMISIASP